MKIFAFVLLALVPMVAGAETYKVWVDQKASKDFGQPFYRIGEPLISGAACMGSKEYCDDLAASLNEAHERRHKTEYQVPPSKAWITPPEKQIKKPLEVIPNSGRVYAPHEIHSINFDYKSACGADDCGKDPGEK